MQWVFKLWNVNLVIASLVSVARRTRGSYTLETRALLPTRRSRPSRRVPRKLMSVAPHLLLKRRQKAEQGETTLSRLRA
jgi:hypothetical protein